MQKLSSRKKLGIIRLYLDGHSYGEIATRSGIGKGSVANIVAELKTGRILDFQGPVEQLELLRELSTDLRRHNLTPGQAVVGISTLTSLQNLGVDPSDIESWAAIFRELAPDEAELRAFTQAALALQEVQKRTGLSFEVLQEKADRLEKEVARLESIAEELRKCPQEIEGLRKRRQGLTDEISQLEKVYKPLHQSVTQKERREHELSHRVQGLEEKTQAADEKLAAARRDMKVLAELGISLDELPGLVNRLSAIAQRHGIKSGELRDRLLQELEALEAGLGLESQLQTKRDDLEEIEHALLAAEQEREALDHALQQLGIRQSALRKSISEEENHIHKEMKSITCIATDAVSKLTQDLGTSMAEAKLEVKKLRDESVKLGREMGKLEATIEANEWLQNLLALAKGDGTVDARQVRGISLSILRWIHSWLEDNQKDIEMPYWFRTQVSSMIQEFVNWKV